MTPYYLLSDDDVLTIFESARHGRPLPSHLYFQVVQVDQIETPLQRQLPEGVYLFVKKHGDNGQLHPIPTTLRRRLLAELPERACQWSLSACPSTTKSKHLEKFYCQPKGTLLYSSTTRGVLWTPTSTSQYEQMSLMVVHGHWYPPSATRPQKPIYAPSGISGLEFLADMTLATTLQPPVRNNDLVDRYRIQMGYAEGEFFICPRQEPLDNLKTDEERARDQLWLSLCDVAQEFADLWFDSDGIV